MSNFLKIGIPVVVVIALIVGGIWYSTMSRSSTETVINSAAAVGTQASSTSDAPTTVTSSDTSDSGITNDMASVDAQMSGLNSDSAAADQSMNAQ